MLNNQIIEMLNDIDENASKTQDVALLLQALDDNENTELNKRQRKILIESIRCWCTEISAYTSAIIIEQRGYQA